MSGIYKLTYSLDDQTHSVELSCEKTTLGRSDDCEVSIVAASVSRVHAQILRDEQGWIITDLNSRNGVFVNRRKIHEARLHDNDKISLGLVELLFNVVQAPADMHVEFRDSTERPEISQSIEVDDFREQLIAKTTEGKLTENKTMVAPEGLIKKRLAPDTSWAIPLFSRAAEALISAVTLDEMFKTVVELVFDNLPAERGCVFQYDESTGQKTLKVMRRKSNEQETKFDISTTVIRQAIERKSSILVVDPFNDQRFSLGDSILLHRIRSVMCAPLIHDNQVIGVIYLDTQSLDEGMRFNSQHLQALTTLALLSAVAVQQGQLRERIQHEQSIRQRLERYSAPSVVDRIVRASAADPSGSMISEEREVSVLFLDIVRFTTLSESLSPLEVTQLLNGVFEQLTDCVFEQEGTLDKFTGDGLMAIFGAPLEQSDHALRAVKAAIRMQQRLCETNIKEDAHRLQVRIGINSGPVLAGDGVSES